jgi:multidrug efflux pump subunit AcrB
MTFLGVIALAGIVINNAIVLLDRIEIEVAEQGLTAQEAVVVAAQRRARPILLTTCTTIASLIPLYMSGPMWSSMAAGIMFGLAFATVLTLGFVPLLYSMVYRMSFRDFDFEGARG